MGRDIVKWNSLDSRQLTDWQGNPITSTNWPVLITSSTTTLIFPKLGAFLGLTITKDVDGGTFYFTDNDDDPIPGLPHVTAQGELDAKGNFSWGRLGLANGMKVVTVSATGLVMSALAFIPER